jgi:hypothetical protein
MQGVGSSCKSKVWHWLEALPEPVEGEGEQDVQCEIDVRKPAAKDDKIGRAELSGRWQSWNRGQNTNSSSG